MVQVWKKLKQVKVGLKQLNTQQFSNIQEKIHQAQSDLDAIQNHQLYSHQDAQLHG